MMMIDDDDAVMTCGALTGAAAQVARLGAVVACPGLVLAVTRRGDIERCAVGQLVRAGSCRPRV